MSNEAGYLTDPQGNPVGTTTNPLVTTASASGVQNVRIEDGASTTLATVTAANALLVDTSQSRSSTATQTSVAGSASSVTILASNANRKMAVVYNDSTAILYLLLGTGPASTSTYTVQIPAQGYFELPLPTFTGQLTGIWASATGNARVTELT